MLLFRIILITTLILIIIASLYFSLFRTSLLSHEGFQSNRIDEYVLRSQHDEFIERIDGFQQRVKISERIINNNIPKLTKFKPIILEAYKKSIQISIRTRTADLRSQNPEISEADAKKQAINDIQQKIQGLQDLLNDFFLRDFPSAKITILNDNSVFVENFTNLTNTNEISDCEKSEIIRITNQLHQQIITTYRKLEKYLPETVEYLIIMAFYINPIIEDAAKDVKSSANELEMAQNMSEAELQSDIVARTQEHREGFIGELTSGLTNGNTQIAQMTTQIQKTCAEKLATSNMRPIPDEIIIKNLTKLESDSSDFADVIEDIEKMIGEYNKNLAIIENTGQQVNKMANAAGFGAISGVDI